MRYFTLLISICVSVFSSFETTAQSKTFKAKSEIISQEHKLTPIFKDFTTFTLNSDQLNNHVANRSWSDNITLQITPELTWSFHLEPVEILTDQSKIYELKPDGRSLSSLKPTVKTFKGIFADGRDGSIRLTMNKGFFYGVINSEGEEYFIEPLQYYIDGSRKDQFIIYKAEDVTEKHNSHTCFRPNEQIIHHDNEHTDGSRLAGACYKAKLAILADYLMFSDPDHSGLDAVIDHLVGVMNNVQAHYEYNGTTNFNDGINFEISEVVVSICPTCDPVSNQTNPNTLLTEFSTWVDQDGFYHPFNAAHLWTDRDFAGPTIGMAYQSQNLYCTSNARAILEDWTNTASLLKIMVAHEIGHNFNGTHDGTSGFILSPTVTTTTTWSSTSKSTISTQIATQGPTCLPTCSAIACPKVENIVVSNINNSNFTVSWAPSAASVYNIKVREYGGTTFITDITTINTSVVLSPPGYGICKQYDVFVYNDCSGSGLSAAQRIITKGPTSQGCAEFVGAKTVGWNGSTISFIDKSINATSWFWDFGNGQTSTIQNPSTTFNGAGNYDVSLRVNNVHTTLKTDVITILPDVMPPFLLEDGGDFESNTNLFTSEVIEGITNAWEFGTSSYVLATQGYAWKSQLNTDIPLGTAKSALISPRFDFTGYWNYTIHFDIGMETIYCNAPFGVQLQYSVNNGTTWSLLGTAPTFYNVGPNEFCTFPTQIFSDRTGWALNSNYNHKSLDLSFLSGQASVVFRFVISIVSGYPDGYNADGVLIDNIRIETDNERVLPLNVGSLVGKKVNETSLLSWSSYNPTDLQSYNIQRSIDGIHFVDIDNVFQERPDKTEFTYTDKFPIQGNNYYRIQALSTNGKTTNSNIVMVAHNILRKVSIFPNPINTHEDLIIVLDGDLQQYESLELIDAMGKVVLKRKIDVYKNNMDLNDLHSGLYHIRIIFSNRTSEYHKIVKV
ncbi:MAG TPA: M12 family metallo-peptidase [Saprospiraceae bacterium]|nr:M12 family metallo-peptidase [Saprospiraceae bacterium]